MPEHLTIVIVENVAGKTARILGRWKGHFEKVLVAIASVSSFSTARTLAHITGFQTLRMIEGATRYDDAAWSNKKLLIVHPFPVESPYDCTKDLMSSQQSADIGLI